MSKSAAMLKEPLLHFLVGALLIFVWTYIAGDSQSPDRIVFTEADVARLKANWRQNFYREPTKAELDGLIDAAIVEEIYYREALKLGLDQGDPVVRRRLVTKLQFLNEQSPGEFVPTDEVLEDWLGAHPEKYRIAAEYDLMQLYLGEEEAVDLVEIEQLVVGLNAGSVQPDQIDNTLRMLPTGVKGNPDTLRDQFGSMFTDSLEELVTGQWVGPIRSGFGIHVVKLQEKRSGRQPFLSEVRQRVLNDWRVEQLDRAETETLAGYLSNYEIRVFGREQ